MIRSVVHVTWSDAADADRRAATVAAQRVHLAVIAEHVRPFLAARSAVQYEV